MCFWLFDLRKKYFANFLKVHVKCVRNLKLFFENLPSKASSLQFNFWPCEQFSLEPAIRIVPNLNRRLSITWNLIQWNNLAFKGQNGQKRPNHLYFSHICPYETTPKSCLLWPSIIIWFQKLSGRASKRGCFTVAWPSRPLKAKNFSPNNFSNYPWVMVKIWWFSVQFSMGQKTAQKCHACASSEISHNCRNLCKCV